MILMFQREVAERIVAAPGSKTYGRLSVLAGWRTQARILFDVAPTAFVPPPKVTSSLVRLEPRAAPLACSSPALQRVTEAAFGQRRKMLRQSLKTLGVDPAALLDAAGIDPTTRAEDVPVEGFVAMARAFVAAGTSCRHPEAGNLQEFHWLGGIRCASTTHQAVAQFRADRAGNSPSRNCTMQGRVPAPYIPACRLRTKVESPVWRSRLRRSAARIAHTSRNARSRSRLITT